MKAIAVIIALLLLAGCSHADTSPESSLPESSSPGSSESESSASEVLTGTEPIADENVRIEITDRNGGSLGEISQYGLATLTDCGIFYESKSADDPDGKTYDYRLFDPSTGKDTALGTVSDRDYEPGYARTELGDCLYALIVTGSLMNDEPEQQRLYRFDLKAGTAREVHSAEGKISPYTSMTAANGKVLFFEQLIIDGTWQQTLMEYDPETDVCRSVLTMTFDGSSGDSPRQLCADDDHIYILRLTNSGGGRWSLMLDTYDFDYDRLSEQDITLIYVKALGEDTPAEDIDSELRQPASRLAVIGGQYIYYENFSITRFLGDLKAMEPIAETGGLFTASLGSGEIFWFESFGGTYQPEDESKNTLCTLSDGKLQYSEYLDSKDSRYQIQSASVSPGGKKLLLLTYQDPEDRSNSLPEKYVLLDS